MPDNKNVNRRDQSGSAVVASQLAGQLGTDARGMARGKYDMRRLTVIADEDIPLFLYASVRAKKSRTWALIRDELINLKVSVGGRGRRDIIRMEQVSHGGAAEVNSEINRPGWFGRNLTKRDWQEQAEADGKI